MAVSTIPEGGFSLHYPSPDMDTRKHNSKSAILFKLSQSMLNDLREASNTNDGLQFVTGKAPVRLPTSQGTGTFMLRPYLETSTGQTILRP